MKKIVFGIAILVSLIGLVAVCAPIADVEYSDEFIHRLEVCGPYSETRKIQSKNLTLNVSNIILGVRNGKCAYKSSIFVQEMLETAAEIQCLFTDEQKEALIRKLKAAKVDSFQKAQLRTTLENYAKNRPEVCRVVNYIKD